MTRHGYRSEIIALLSKIDANLPETELLFIIQHIMTKVAGMKYRLLDMPLVTGALNLLISSIVLDYEEKEIGNYGSSIELKTIIDLAIDDF